MLILLCVRGSLSTEAFANVEMSVASKKRVSLRCKVDTGAGGNVMPL